MGLLNWLLGSKEIRSTPISQLTEDDVKQWYFGGYPAAGVSVSVASAMQNATFRACCLRIVQDIGSLPFPVFQNTGDDRAKRRDHQVHRLLNEQANPNCSGRTFRERLQRDALLKGNGLAYIERDTRFAPVWLWPLDPCRSEVIWRNGRMLYKTILNSKPRELEPYDVLHT